MFSFIRDKFDALFATQTPRPISHSSTLASIEKIYPNLENFLLTRYRISLSENNTRSLKLKSLVKKYALPPAQILFMELQMEERVKNVKIISAKEAKDLIEKYPGLALFDTRDQHEWEHHGKIAKAVFLEETSLLKEIKSLEENTPILCYCHFGVRSLNFAAQIADLGYKQVHVIRGGIDEWSLEVDQNLPRYQGDYC